MKRWDIIFVIFPNVGSEAGLTIYFDVDWRKLLFLFRQPSLFRFSIVPGFHPKKVKDRTANA